MPSAAPKKPVIAYVLGALLLLAAATGVGLGVIKLINGPPEKEVEPEKAEALTGNNSQVKLKPSALEKSGVKTELLSKAPFIEVVNVPGRLALDDV